MTEEKKNPVNYTDEDIKKMEEDVRKATSEDQSKAVTEALDKAKKEIESKKELDAMKARQEELLKAIEEKDKAYAQSLEDLKTENKINLDSAITQLKDERQSVVDTKNPFKEGATPDENAAIKQKLRDDPQLMKDLDLESAKAFCEKNGMPLSALHLGY